MGFFANLLRRTTATERTWPPHNTQWAARYRPHLEQFATSLEQIGEPGGVTVLFDQGNKHTHLLRKKDGVLLAEVVIDREGGTGHDRATFINYKLPELAWSTLAELLQIPVYLQRAS